MRTAVISEQGLRSSMEDRHILLHDFWGPGWLFGGIFDGHRGSFAAEYATRHLHKRFLDALKLELDPEQAFAAAYQAIASELKDEHSGTTAVTFFLQKQILTTANCGDSRALIIEKDTTRQLTEDHRLDNEKERERIEQAGSRIVYPYVMSGFQGLMPCRSLGDARFHGAGIIATPYAQSHRLAPKDRFLLVACDGLFDVMSNEEIGAFGRKALDPQDLLQLLQDEVLITRMGVDNLTMIACDLQSSGSVGQ